MADLNFIRCVFLDFHDFYRKKSEDKYCLGNLDLAGQDPQALEIQKIWSESLSRFGEDVLQDSVALCKKDYPKIPPTLQQFSRACGICQAEKYDDEN
jgi:hypothetical protein